MKLFETPNVEVVVFETDVITTSGCELYANCDNDTPIG